MRTVHIATLAAVLAAIATAATAGAQPVSRRTFELVNASHDSVVALAIADAGGRAFEPIALEAPLQGGVSGTTLDIPVGGCLRDLRVTFSDGRRLLYPALDLCRNHLLRIRASDAAAG